MGFMDFLNDVGNATVEKYREKTDEINKYVDRMQYGSERELFEIAYRRFTPGNPFNSEGMAARKVLHDNMGYDYDEIQERISEMYRERRR